MDCSTLPVDCKTVVADCHEPLKGCIDCWKDPTADICTNECLTGPCFYKNDVDVAACVKNNHKLVAECKEEGSRFGHFGGFVLDFTMFIC